MPNAHFGNYWPPSFGWTGQYDPFSNPSCLVDFSFDGVSFGLMNKYVVPLFTAFLTELVPHLPGGLHAGKCGCYNPKSLTVGGTRSFHTFAIAVDVNWDDNPMGNTNTNMPDHFAHALAQKYGLEWGGDWSSPVDRMHFEVHLSPTDISSWLSGINPPEVFTMDSEARAAFTKLQAEVDAIKEQLSSGVNVSGLENWAHNGYGTVETFLSGIPGYVPLAQRKK